MSLSPDSFEGLAQAIAAANNLPLETARKYATYVGDTPELGEDGRVIVRDKSDTELARIIIPFDE